MLYLISFRKQNTLKNEKTERNHGCYQNIWLSATHCDLLRLRWSNDFSVILSLLPVLFFLDQFNSKILTSALVSGVINDLYVTNESYFSFFFWNWKSFQVLFEFSSENCTHWKSNGFYLFADEYMDIAMQEHEAFIKRLGNMINLCNVMSHALISKQQTHKHLTDTKWFWLTQFSFLSCGIFSCALPRKFS